MPKRPNSRPPFAMVEKMKGGRLSPVGPYDAVIVDQARVGAVYDLVPKKKRSDPQLGLYWMVLHAVVEGTGVWPDAEALHEELVIRCGFIRPVLNIETGLYDDRRDSIAFDAMEPDRFNLYMTMALAKLGEFLGLDPLDLLPPDVRSKL